MISGMIHREVLDDFGSRLVPSAVLVIKNLHVIMSERSHYIIVTTENLVNVYKPQEPGSGEGEVVALDIRLEQSENCNAPNLHNLERFLQVFFWLMSSIFH